MKKTSQICVRSHSGPDMLVLMVLMGQDYIFQLRVFQVWQAVVGSINLHGSCSLQRFDTGNNRIRLFIHNINRIREEPKDDGGENEDEGDEMDGVLGGSDAGLLLLGYIRHRAVHRKVAVSVAGGDGGGQVAAVLIGDSAGAV